MVNRKLRNVSGPRLRVRGDNWRDITASRGLTTGGQVADALGVNRTSLSLVVNGRRFPSERFIARSLNLFGPDTFPTLFTVIET